MTVDICLEIALSLGIDIKDIDFFFGISTSIQGH